MSRLEVEPASNGGYVVKEYYKQGSKGDMSYMEPSTKVASDMAELTKIMGKCFDCD